MRLIRLIMTLSMVFTVAVVTAGPAVSAPEVLYGEVLSVHDKRCLDVYANGAGPWVQVWTCNGQPNQKFRLVWYPDAQNYEIRTNDYWCVDGRWGKGASLERSPCSGHPGQRFRIQPHGVHYGWAIYSVQHPNLVWDVYGFGGGTKVQLWEGNKGSNQAWFLPW